MPKAKKVKVGDEMKASNHNDLVEDIATLTATIAEFEARVSVLEGNVTPAAKSKAKAVKE